MGTITRAYAEVERQGLIGGEVGRGTYVKRRDRARFPTVPAEGTATINLELNWPVPVGEGEDFARTLAEISAANGAGELLAYQPHVGTLAHREAGARWVRRYGLEVSPAQVVVCSGAQHAMEVALGAICRPGEVLLTEALTYPGVKRLAERLGVRLQGVALDDEGIKPDALAAACRSGAKALYAIPTHQNPTAAVMSEERRKKLAAIVRQFGLTVIEDDAYGLLLEKPLPPLATFVPEQTYFIAGTSKLLSPGLRIAYLVAPSDQVEQLAQGVWMTNWMAAPLTAEVAARWITDGTAESLLKRRRKEALFRMKRAREVLGPALGTRPLEPAIHQWLRLPGRWRAESFAAQARRAGVAIGPAELFSVEPHAPPAGARLCLGPPRTREELDEGLARLKRVLDAGPECVPSIV